MQICILNHEQVSRWELTGHRPLCKFHHHTSFNKALRAVKEDEAIWVIELRAIIMYTCVLSYVWQGKRSAGYSTMQLTQISGRKSPLGLCEAARKA